MSTFRFFLKDPGSSNDWGEGNGYVTGLNLKDLFDQVCQHPSCPFSYSDFFWNPNAGDIKDNELLVYVLHSKSDSIIRGIHSGATLGAGGTTYFTNNYSLSEVYFDTIKNDPDSAKLLANLIFHEFIHNKLKKGNSIHAMGGLASATVYSGTILSSNNIVTMAKVLDKKVTQYTSAL